MKNLPAELMWLDSAKKQVELAKDAYREAKIHFLNSIKDTETVVSVISSRDVYKAMVLAVDEINNTVKLALEIDKLKFAWWNIDTIDILAVTDENGNITIKIIEV